MTSSVRLAVFLLLGISAAAQPVTPPDQFFDSSGVRIRYVEQGQGTPIVLVHGLTGNLDRHWIANGVFAALAKDHRTIAMDARGHGKSGKPHDPKMYGEQMARDVVALLDHLKIPRAHFVGYSMGAMIGGRLLSMSPERVITMAFVAHHPIRALTAKDEAENEAQAQDMEGPIPFKRMMLSLLPAPPPDEEIRKMTAPLVAANDVLALAAFWRGYRTFVITDKELSAVRVPMIEIIGTLDPGYPELAVLAKAHPHIKTLAVEGAEHGGERGILRRAETMDALRELWAGHR